MISMAIKSTSLQDGTHFLQEGREALTQNTYTKARYRLQIFVYLVMAFLPLLWAIARYRN